jgi:hypothetical protein
VAGQADLGGGYTIVLRRSADGLNAYVALVTGSATVQWHTFPYQYAGELHCNIAGSVRNCVVINGVGAHASAAYPVLFDGAWLHIGEAATSDTPVIDAYDIDGDNRLDVAALQNNYTPSYANGKVQWQTWRRSTDGTSWKSTGCGPLAAAPPPRPNAFLTGACSG